MTAHATEALTTSQRLGQLVDDAEGEDIPLRWILAELHERAFGLFLLVGALPCSIPFLYVLPQIVALPLLFVSGQLMIGRRLPWLPDRLGARTVSKKALETLVRRANPFLLRIEAFSRPRLVPLTRRPADQLVGLALVLFSASIFVPLPGTNTIPGISIVVISMGLLQRDGLLVLLGGMLGTAWIAALIIAGATLTTLIRGWAGL
jgi:hypothetical protein